MSSRCSLRAVIVAGIAASLLAACWAPAGAASISEATDLLSAGASAEAARMLEAIVAEAPDDLPAHFWLGRSRAALGDLDGAAEQFQLVLDAKPTSVESRYWLGEVRRLQGRLSDARAAFNEVLEGSPDHREAKVGLQRVAEEIARQQRMLGDTLTDWVLPIDEHRVALDISGLQVDPGRLDIYSDHVYDYTFSDPPTDWTTAGGLWEATSRWTCSPQWSWFGGVAKDGVAAVWNKRQFTGDITVEAYCAFKMGVMQGASNYRNPNDMNITICGDGANIDSGYSFIYGGDLNSRSRIVRGTETLAETRAPEALLPVFEDGFPSTYEFHRKWWALRVRKTGDLLQFYVDEKLIAETRDPQPLDAGRVAIWARDNGLILSRIKIYYEHEITPREAAPIEHLRSPIIASVADRQLNLSSTSHQSLFNGFEVDLGGVTGRDDTQGAVVSLEAPGAASSAHCARLANAHAGGTFGTTLYAGSFDVRKLPRLSFDYRLDPDARVNLYLTAGEQLCEVIFAGAPYAAPGAQLLGTIPDVQADGAWHHVEFDLLGHLEGAGLDGQALIARDLFLGNLTDDDYLDAGFGANHAGATIYLDNLSVYHPAGAELQLAASPLGEAKVEGYAVGLTDVAGVAPRAEVNSTDGKITLEAERDGVWYVNVCPLFAGGEWGSVHSTQVVVDTQPPTVLGVSPEGSTLSTNGPIEIRVSDGAGIGVDPASIRVRIGEHEYGIAAGGVRFDPSREVVEVYPHLLGHIFSGAGKLDLTLMALADRNGLALAKPASWSWDVGPGADREMPPPPMVTVGDTPLLQDDFEDAMGEWANWGGDGGAVLSLDSTTAAQGERSLKLYNPINGGTFGAYVRKTSFDAGKYRLVRFWYKIPERLRADFVVFVNGDKKSIRFTDTDSGYERIGEVPEVRADNEWHHAEFDLYQMLRRTDPHAPGYKVHQMLLTDSGWSANAPGQTYHIDDFQLVPISSAAQPLRIAWAIQDLTGLGGANWAIDTEAATELPTNTATSADHVEYNDQGVDGWLHVRACDNAGNWGPTTHQRLLIDSSAPVAKQVTPPADVRTAVSEIKLNLSDNGIAGIDPASVVLAVGDTDYTVSNGGLTYLSERGELIYNCEQTSPRPTVFADGQQVRVQLKEALDFAGNRVAAMPDWTWTMDYSKDTQPPRIDRVECRTHHAVIVQTFEDGVDGWGNRGGASGAKVEHDTTQAGSGSGSVKLTQQRDGGHMQAMVTNTPFGAEDYPVIAFDYRIDKGVELSLMVNMEGRWHAVALTDDGQGAIGRVSGVRADGKWHYAMLHLAPLLRRQQRRGALNVQAIIIGDREPFKTPAGASANFDNFIVGRVGTSKPVFRWQATDTTGISGYSYVLDQEPATEPPNENMGDKVAMTFSDLKQGLWFLHVRAVDGAGNWGPTTHYGIMHAGN